MEPTGVGAKPEVIRRDSFKISGNEVTVILTDNGIEWTGKGRSRNGSIEWAEVLNVTPIPTSCRKPKGPGVTLHYIAKPNKQWRQASVFLQTPEEDVATLWVQKVNHMLLEKVPQRPRRLLVFVNPKSGSSKGVKVYENKVVPIFKLAGIIIDATVTEKAHHAVELIKKADLSQYDGIILVGGDGTFTEGIVGLAAVKRAEAGVDPDDESADLPFINMRVGIIPAGTGQGMVETATGCKGVENAALHIIYGNTWDLDLVTAHNGRRLIYTSCLLFGYGFFGETIRISENNRQMGTFRYVYALGKAISDIRPFNVTLDVLVQGSDGKPPEWIRRGEEGYTNIFHFMASPGFHTLHDGKMHLYLEKPTSSISRIKLFTKLIKQTNNHIVLPSFVEYLQALSYKITPYSAGNSATSTAGGLPYDTLNIDGECFSIDVPQVTVRIHPKKIKMFGDYVNQWRAEKERSQASGSGN